MFEDRTYENIMSECLALAPAGIDLRQGGIYYDAVASACFKIAELYMAVSTCFDLCFVGTAVGEYLDRKGAEYNIARNQATQALYEYLWTGTVQPALGERFFADGRYFALMRGDDGRLCLQAETPGSDQNNILYGTAAVPVNNIGGLTSSTFGSLIQPGADTESDDDYRRRIQEKIAGPAENGNKQHYKTWCESVAGVGRARIIPLFAGENTVMAVLIGTDGLPASPYVVGNVQNYVDPMTQGLTAVVDGQEMPIGDGLGDGVANIGAHFAAVAPDVVTINISFDVELTSSGTASQVQADAEEALSAYLVGVALSADPNQWVVRISAISSILYAINGLVDYSNLLVNDQAANIELSERQIGVLGAVSVNAVI